MPPYPILYLAEAAGDFDRNRVEDKERAITDSTTDRKQRMRDVDCAQWGCKQA